MFSDWLKKVNPFGAQPKKERLVRGGPERIIGGAGLVFREEPEPGGFGAWLGRLIGRKKEPELGAGEKEAGGHRGRAFGDLQNPDLSQENVRQWRAISPEEAEKYIEGELFIVHSTNCREFQYHPREQKLTAVFDARDGRGSRTYIYSNVSRKEMALLVAASSKGASVWSLLIGRGPKTRVNGKMVPHIKNYERLS